MNFQLASQFAQWIDRFRLPLFKMKKNAPVKCIVSNKEGLECKVQLQKPESLILIESLIISANKGILPDLVAMVPIPENEGKKDIQILQLRFIVYPRKDCPIDNPLQPVRLFAASEIPIPTKEIDECLKSYILSILKMENGTDTEIRGEATRNYPKMVFEYTKKLGNLLEQVLLYVIRQSEREMPGFWKFGLVALAGLKRSKFLYCRKPVPTLTSAQRRCIIRGITINFDEQRYVTFYIDGKQRVQCVVDRGWSASMLVLFHSIYFMKEYLVEDLVRHFRTKPGTKGTVTAAAVTNTRKEKYMIRMREAVHVLGHAWSDITGDPFPVAPSVTPNEGPSRGRNPSEQSSEDDDDSSTDEN